MKLTPTSIAWLALFFGLACAQTAYDNTCNPPPSGEQVVEPGLVAFYGCGDIHNQGDYAGNSVLAITPEDCAKQCDKRTPEGPCSWHSGTCYFYNAGAGSAGWSQAVTIKTRKDYASLKAAYDQSKVDSAAWKAAYDQCEIDKTACEAAAGGGSGGPPGQSGPPGQGGPPSQGGPSGGTAAPGDRTCEF